jgi:hypothetical protein
MMGLLNEGMLPPIDPKPSIIRSFKQVLPVIRNVVDKMRSPRDVPEEFHRQRMGTYHSRFLRQHLPHALPSELGDGTDRSELE